MRRHATSLPIFLLFVIGLIAALKLVDWIPGAFHPGTVRSYANIADARSRLGIAKVYVPAYFPRSLEWPPSRVLAQSKPFEAVELEFRDVDSGAIALVITQTASPRLRQRPRIHLERIEKTSLVDLKGREAIVESGSCDSGEPCSRVTFAEGGLWLKVEMRSLPEELLVLARSMVGVREP